MLMQWLPKMKNLNPKASFHSIEAAQKAPKTGDSVTRMSAVGRKRAVVHDFSRPTSDTNESV